MSVSGNEIGDLLVDIGLITPEELENAHLEQARTGERLTLVLDKLGLVSNNQLKDALELQFGVNYVSLSKNPPKKEIVELLPEETRSKYRVLPIAQSGTQYTIAMVDPDDMIAIDTLRIQLKSGNLKKVVCTADDFEFVSKLLSEPEPAPTPVVAEVVKVEVAAKTESKADTAVKKNKPGKMPARKQLANLFDDDEDDDDDKEKQATPAKASEDNDLLEPISKSEEQLEENSNGKSAVSENKNGDHKEVTTPLQTVPGSEFLLPEEELAKLHKPLEPLEPLEPIESVVAAVTNSLVETAPSLDDPQRLLLEEVVESEFDNFTDSDFLESLIPEVKQEEPAELPPREVQGEGLSDILDALIGDDGPLIQESLFVPAPEVGPEPVAEPEPEVIPPEIITAPEPVAKPEPEVVSEPELVAEPEPEPVAEPEPEVIPEPEPIKEAESVKEPEPAPAPAPAKPAQAPGEQLMTLAKDIVTKAVQQKWSDIHLEPEATGMCLRYFKSGEVLADVKLPLQLNSALSSSYKKMAGLNPSETTRPQDKKFDIEFASTNVEMRVTTMPAEHGEMIAISLKYP